MTSRTWICAAVVAVAGSAAVGRADESNRNEVRANLEKGGWTVVWGKNFTEADWARGTKAIAESVAAENPGPFLAWFERALEENFDKIERNLKGVARKDLERWVAASLKAKKVITYKGLEIQAGFATYDRWDKVSYDEPRTRKKKVKDPFGIGWTYVPEVYTERVEKKVNLPNWHQFYVRYKLTKTDSGSGTGGGSNKPSVVRPDDDRPGKASFEYSIRNDSGQAVRFRLPSGKEYTLKAGERGSYTFTGDPAAARIHVYDSNRDYLLAAGAHRFWWMSAEKRIGLDVAGK